MDELMNIQGVGVGKAHRYGKEFIALIKRHCEENEIERPEDLRIRTVPKKSMLKVKIIQSIDRKVALDDIADAQNIEFDDLLNEIEAIVYSGTKLNIDYFLEDVMDDDTWMTSTNTSARAIPTTSIPPWMSWAETIRRMRRAWCV